jgi:hypothetical protein
MPQGERTPGDKVGFKWQLENINALYSSMRVLILLDMSYVSTEAHAASCGQDRQCL